MSKFDHVVVGSGIVGSWTALCLKRLGKNVLLVDQFGEPNTRGSSHGHSRIIRSSYPQKFFAEMMPHAYKMWDELAEETGQEIIAKAKYLAICSTSAFNKAFNDSLQNMKSLYPDQLDELKPGEVNTRYPTTLKYGAFTKAFLDKSGGVINAIKTLLAVQTLYRKKGGVMWENCEVTKIVPEGQDVKLTTEKGDVTAKSVVVCAGPWAKRVLTPDLIPSLPLEPQVITVFYWREKVKGAYSLSSGFPTLYDFDGSNAFAFPSHEYPGLVKASFDKGNATNDPDERDKVSMDQRTLENLKKYIRDHFPLLESEPAIIEKCLYTMTPDKNFIVDTLPSHKNIVIGAGFSGTGYKTAPVIGRMLSEMATGKAPFLDATPFRLSRFNKA
ncbi:peroxisomal sarcosine oxidase-like [Uloborus diversus]|uniref:peroxisomal sarcosine oxidase-like n=1 Tax=Uloborus diversus TaxID=327109 RepID=UPI002408F5A9|nr:peroxisomal sarcosine oxidase-like [Uloborus diversus]